MTYFNDVTIVKMRKRGTKNEILLLFERTCFMNGPLFY